MQFVPEWWKSFLNSEWNALSILTIIIFGLTPVILPLWHDQDIFQHCFPIVHGICQHGLPNKLTFCPGCFKLLFIITELRDYYYYYYDLSCEVHVIHIITFFSFEASELQSWLLFYALPCLVGFLPDKYLQHFACFSEAIYILLGSGITPTQLKSAKDLLDKFYKDFQTLYGMNKLFFIFVRSVFVLVLN